MFEPNTELLEWFADGMPVDEIRYDDPEDGAPAAQPDAIPAPAGPGVPAGGRDARQAS